MFLSPIYLSTKVLKRATEARNVLDCHQEKHIFYRRHSVYCFRVSSDFYQNEVEAVLRKIAKSEKRFLFLIERVKTL